MKTIKVLLVIVIVVLIGSGGYIVSKHLELDNHEHNESSETLDESNDNEPEAAHEEDAEHEEHAIELTPEEIEEIGLKTALAGPGEIDKYLTLPGQIGLNKDKMVHIVPRVEGIVKKVNKKLGDDVQAGDVLAIIESPELADIKAEFLASNERYKIAQLSFLALHDMT